MLRGIDRCVQGGGLVSHKRTLWSKGSLGPKDRAGALGGTSRVHPRPAAGRDASAKVKLRRRLWSRITWPLLPASPTVDVRVHLCCRRCADCWRQEPLPLKYLRLREQQPCLTRFHGHGDLAGADHLDHAVAPELLDHRRRRTRVYDAAAADVLRGVLGGATFSRWYWSPRCSSLPSTTRRRITLHRESGTVRLPDR